jgi:hypothetical protein
MNRQAKDEASVDAGNARPASASGQSTPYVVSHDRDHGVEAEQAKRLISEAEKLGVPAPSTGFVS